MKTADQLAVDEDRRQEAKDEFDRISRLPNAGLTEEELAVFEGRHDRWEDNKTQVLTIDQTRAAFFALDGLELDRVGDKEVGIVSVRVHSIGDNQWLRAIGLQTKPPSVVAYVQSAIVLPPSLKVELISEDGDTILMEYVEDDALVCNVSGFKSDRPLQPDSHYKFKVSEDLQ